MKRLIITFLCAFTLASCSAVINSMQETNLTERTVLDLEVYQTLSETSAIAFTKDNKAVKVVSYDGMMYDGKQISGSFILVGTYTYIANNGMEKTIPTYVRLNELKRYREEQEHNNLNNNRNVIKL